MENFALWWLIIWFCLCCKGEIKPKDFSESLGAYSLSEVGRKTSFERKMNDFNYIDEQSNYRLVY